MPSSKQRHLYVGGFLGDQQSIPSLSLPSIFSSGGSKNLWLDQYGVAASIDGYTKQNAVPVLTNTGNLPTRGRALYHYGLQSGGALTRQDIGIFEDGLTHWEFRISTDIGVSWVFKADYGIGSVGAIPDFAQLGNALVMVNGVFAAQSWDGTTLAAATNTQLAAPTITNVGAGQITGNVQWKIVPFKTDGTRKFASVASLVTPLNQAKAKIDWVADADLSVGSYEVYRTTGTGKVFYYVATVVGRLTVTLTENTADLDLIANAALQQYGDTPPSGIYYVEAHGQRIWYLGTDADPRKAWYSDPGLPFSVYAENFLDMTDAESLSDKATGATGAYKGMLVVWLERSVWTVSGRGVFNGPIIDYTRKRTDAKAGTVSHRTVARIPAGAKFTNARGEFEATQEVTLAYLTPKGDIRLFDGNNDTIISFAKAKTLARLSYAHRRKAYCVTDEPRGEVTWVFPADSATECSYAVSWNYRFGTWDERDWPFAHAIETESAVDASFLLGVESSTAKGGFVYLLWNGTSFDGVGINARLMLKTLYGVGDQWEQKEVSLGGEPLMSFEKRWRWADLLLDIIGAVNVTVEWLPGEAADDAPGIGTVDLSAVTETLRDGEGNTILDANGNTIVLPVTPAILRARFLDGSTFSDGLANPRYLYSRGMRLRISINSATGKFRSIGMDIMYQVLPGLKRTFRR